MRNNLRIFGLTLLLFTFSFSYASEKIIMIDVSHGGEDNGVAIDGYREKDLAFEIARKVVALNTSDSVKIILTREGDYFLSLKDRAEYINSINPNYVISLHVNSSGNSETNGFDFMVSSESIFGESSNALAQQIENSISKEFSSNGIKNANFYILKNVKMPITLIEMGYLTNPTDRKLLTSVAGQDKIAAAIYNTIK